MKTILILLVVFVASWDLLWRLLGITPVSPRRLRDTLEKSHHQPLLLDVRTAKEYDWFHIRGAESRPGLLLHPEAFSTNDPEQPLVVICLSGHRSPVAAYRLRQRGYKNVSYLVWGMIAWVASGAPTVKGE